MHARTGPLHGWFGSPPLSVHPQGKLPWPRGCEAPRAICHRRTSASSGAVEPPPPPERMRAYPCSPTPATWRADSDCEETWGRQATASTSCLRCSHSAGSTLDSATLMRRESPRDPMCACRIFWVRERRACSSVAHAVSSTWVATTFSSAETAMKVLQVDQTIMTCQLLLAVRTSPHNNQARRMQETLKG